LQKDGVYEQLEAKGAWLEAELVRAAVRGGAEVTVNRAGSLLTVFFSGRPVHDLEGAKQVNLHQFKQFFQGMLARGIYLPPSQFEAWFISLAHSAEDLEKTAAAAREVLRGM
jgi:glutamate-1-semialdehyde 2,1-aminomutase